MATQYYYFKGTAYWAKHQDFQYEEEFNKWSIDVELDEESQKLFGESKCQVSPVKKPVNEGAFQIQFRRPGSKEIKGELVEFEPPKTMIKKGDDWEDYVGNIGNGSEVVVKVAVYDTSRGKGHRLESIGITNLVEYEPSGDSGNGEFPF